MIQNILGLPNYVIGEILSSAGEHVVGSRTISSHGSTVTSNIGLLRIGKDTPGLTSLLTFDLPEKHLSKSCHQKTQQQPQQSATLQEPRFSVQKQFTLVNYGKSPVHVRGFLIGPHVGVSSSSYKSKSTLASLNDQPIGSNQLLSQLIGHVYCQGFGFKVLNCDLNQQGVNSSEGMFELEPNESKKISIAFTPDFTIAKTLATLTVITGDGPFDEDAEKPWTQVLKEQLLHKSWLASFFCSQEQPKQNNKAVQDEEKKLVKNIITYSLVATVPKTLLSSCDESLPRPYQEMIMYYTLVVFMVCLVMVTVACAFIDGTRVLNFTFYPAVLMTRPATSVDNFAPDSFKPFNLKMNGETVVSTKKNSHSSSSETSTTTSSNKKKNDQGKNKTSESWTSYLKNKLVCPRRGSNGSNTSSLSDGKGGSGGKNLANVMDSKGKKKKEATAAALRRKLNAKSWFESLSSRTDEKREEDEPLPLPSFDDAFDDQDIQYLTGTKKGKRHVELAPKKEKAKQETPNTRLDEKKDKGSNSSNIERPNNRAVSNDSPGESPPTQLPISPLLPSLQTLQSTSYSEPNFEPKTPDFVSSLIGHDFGTTKGIRNGTANTSQGTFESFSPYSTLLSSPFNDSSTEFGYWNESAANGSTSRSSGGYDCNLIWDSPITMFEPEKAMKELIQQKQQQRSQSLSSPVVRNGGSKSGLCPVGPPPGLGGRSESVSEAEQHSIRNSFPPIGTFQVSDVFTKDNNGVNEASHMTRPPTTSSPHGWSPSHKVLQSATSFADEHANMFPTQNGTPIQDKPWPVTRMDLTDALKWDASIQPPVQRRSETATSRLWDWPSILPTAKQAEETSKLDASWQKSSTSSSWNPFASTTSPEASSSTNSKVQPNSFSLFGGQSPWSPLSGSSVGAGSSFWPFSTKEDSPEQK